MAAKVPILEVRNLSLHFGQGAACVKAVDQVSFQVGAGETVALVGESGSGKSLSALALTRLVPRTARYAGGEALFGGEDLLMMPERKLRQIRGARIAYIFQEPTASFNPVYTVGAQIEEALKLHRRGVDYRLEVGRLLDQVHLPSRMAKAYPHQMSGGQLQRCMIAMALACSPQLLVADEPTTALDVTVQREILNLLNELRDSTGLSTLLITHNFGVVSEVADRVYVMQRGQIVEHGETQRILKSPEHPYTQKLLAAVPRLHPVGA